MKFLLISAILISVAGLVTGCGASAGRNWYYHYGPVEDSIVDNPVMIRSFSTFSIVPYSEIGTEGSHTGSIENSMMFALANDLMSNGYGYRARTDSVDFILTARTSNDYIPGQDLKPELERPPRWGDAQPFSLISSPFGNEWDTPQPLMHGTQDRLHPKVKIFVYDGKTHKLLRRWICGATVGDVNERLSEAHLFFEFSNRIGASHDTSNYPPVQSGKAGFGCSVYSWDGVNYWPYVSNVPLESAAAEDGLYKGDVLLELDDRSLKNIDIYEVLRRLRGEVGRVLHLKVWRWTSETREVDITMRKR